MGAGSQGKKTTGRGGISSLPTWLRPECCPRGAARGTEGMSEQVEAGQKDIKCEAAKRSCEKAMGIKGSSWTAVQAWLKLKTATVRLA